MKKKNAPANPSKEPVSNKKSVQKFDSLWRQRPVSDKYLDDLAIRLRDWALYNEEAFKLSQFILEEGVWEGNFFKWLERNENLREAHKDALTAIGNRREIGALKKKLDSSLTTLTMPMYDPEWKKFIEWKSSLTQANKEEGGTKIVVIEKFPESPLVPAKKDVEDV